MAGNLEIVADPPLKTLSEFQSQFMAPKIPQVIDSVKKNLQETIQKIESELIQICLSALGSGALTIEIEK